MNIFAINETFDSIDGLLEDAKRDCDGLAIMTTHTMNYCFPGKEKADLASAARDKSNDVCVPR